MTPERAKRLLADTLAGEPTPSEQLAAALRLVNQDAPFVSHVRNQVAPERREFCATFAELMDAFISLTDEERKEEMPDCVAHLQLCPDCQTLASIVAAADPWSGEGQVRHLRCALQVSVDPRGEITAAGIAPDAVETHATAMSRESPARLQWRLEDEEHSVSIVLQLASDASGFTLWPQFEVGDGQQEAGLEVGLRDQLPLFTGALHDLAQQGIQLTPGRWQLMITSLEHAWTIELVLAAGPTIP